MIQSKATDVKKYLVRIAPEILSKCPICRTSSYKDEPIASAKSAFDPIAPPVAIRHP
jgi:hypothetical protein